MNYSVDLAHIFTIFFIMLGPVKLLVPYAQATRNLEANHLRRLSCHAAFWATVIAIAGGYSGSFLLEKWSISVPILMLAAGIILFLVALHIVLPPPAMPGHADNNIVAIPTVMQVVFPMIITPYGMAALIVFLTTSQDTERTLAVLVLVVVNMVLNFLAMTFVRPILKFVTPTGMQIIFSVLGILMVGLGLQIIYESLVSLHIVAGIR